jgi:hypothetical protein
MTKEQLAAQLNGREYPLRISKDEQTQAKKDGLVIIFGASDDLVEFDGAIYDEAGAWGGVEILISKGAILEDIEPDEEEVLKKHGVYTTVKDSRKSAIKITARWCKYAGYFWFIEASVPFAPFDVMEEGTTFCRGVVIDLPREV